MSSCCCVMRSSIWCVNIDRCCEFRFVRWWCCDEGRSYMSSFFYQVRRSGSGIVAFVQSPCRHCLVYGEFPILWYDMLRVTEPKLSWRGRPKSATKKTAVGTRCHKVPVMECSEHEPSCESVPHPILVIGGPESWYFLVGRVSENPTNSETQVFDLTPSFFSKERGATTCASTWLALSKRPPSCILPIRNSTSIFTNRFISTGHNAVGGRHKVLLPSSSSSSSAAASSLRKNPFCLGGKQSKLAASSRH